MVTSSLAEAAAWPDYHRWAQRLNLNSLCLLPLTTAGRRLGALAFVCKQPGVYDGRDIEFLQLAATQVAVAVDNALNYGAALASRQQLAHERDRLAFCWRSPNRSLHTATLVRCFVISAGDSPASSHSITSFCFCMIPSARSCACMSWRLRNQAPSDRGMELPVDETSAGLVWKTQQPLMVEDVATETRFPRLISHCARMVCNLTAPFR